jgi:hypothetical protein
METGISQGKPSLEGLAIRLAHAGMALKALTSVASPELR